MNNWSHYEARAETEDKVNTRPHDIQLFRQLEQTCDHLDKQLYKSMKLVEDRMEELKNKMAYLKVVTTPLGKFNGKGMTYPTLFKYVLWCMYIHCVGGSEHPYLYKQIIMNDQFCYVKI